MNKVNKKVDFKLVWIILLYIALALILVGGCLLIGFGHKSYLVFNDCLNESQQLGMSWSEFWQQIANFNKNAADFKTTASIDLFAPGIVLFVVAIIGLALNVFWNIKYKKNKISN